MKSFPMFIKTTGRRVVIAGGGEQAAQKARLILKTDAQIVLAAPELDDELLALVNSDRAMWHQGPISPELFKGAAMGFIASGCPGIDASLHALAVVARCPINVVDQPELCELTTPSLVDRDPVVVAIGTEGTAPVLARQVKTKVEEMLAPNLGGLAGFAGRMREAVAARVPREQRRAFWRWVFAETPRQDWTQGREKEAAKIIKKAIRNGKAPDSQTEGSLSLVGAGPGARDLLTLRAVERLQEADIIFYDRLVDPEVLELARRDAERVFVGKVVGAHAWPQDRINQVIIAAALEGKRVVRLKSGDPSIFGRAGEEIEAARTAGVSVEIVPGVTAACAAAASLTQPLTERGISDALVLATGHGCPDDPDPEATRFMTPGTTTAFYMSVSHAANIQNDLLAKGMSPDCQLCVSVDVSKPAERHINCRLDDLIGTIKREEVTGCAVILATWPKDARAIHAAPAKLIAAQ